MRFRAQGITLIELMVALAIGSLLIVGTVFVYSQSRSTYRVSDTVARLQENARYAFSVIESDLQLAGNYGFSNDGGDFSFVSNGSTAGIPSSGLTPASPLVDLGGANACGRNFALYLTQSIEGEDEAYSLPCVPMTEKGVPLAGRVASNTDRLTIRRASGRTSDPTAGNVQLLVNRLSHGDQFIFADGVRPGPNISPGMVEVRNVVVRTYYVSNDTEKPSRPGVPALRVKSLEEGPAFVDREIISGVEDFQVELGIELGNDTDGDGLVDMYSGAADRYVKAGAVPPGYRAVSARVSLLMRADQPEQGFRNTRGFEYAGKIVPASNDGYRRVLVSRTIQLRNSRTM